MSERVRITAQKTEAKNENSVSRIKKTDYSQSVNSPINYILNLQRTVGNQAVQRLFKSGVVQAKLKIGHPNDIYEQEADRVEEQVMSMPEPGVQRQVEAEEEEEFIQTKIAGDVTPEVTPTISSGIQSLQGGGRPLSGPERSFFEPRFESDFSNVRVHNDTRAANIARSINARAFMLGNNIVFGAGEYCPDASSGRKLLAHELTHVLQQSGGSTLFSLDKNSENTLPNSHESGIISPEFLGHELPHVIQHVENSRKKLHLKPDIVTPESEIEREGWRFRRDRQRELARIISGMRFRKIRRDCPIGTSVRLLSVLGRMQPRVTGNPRCMSFFRRYFGITPNRLFAPNSSPTITVDAELDRSGRCRCPEPSVRIQPAVCRSRWLERVIMHEFTHYAGCLTPARTPCSEELAERGADICIGTHREVLEEERKLQGRGVAP